MDLPQWADLARERETHFKMAAAIQTPKYGRIRTESRLFRAPSRRHLTLLNQPNAMQR